MKHGTLIDSARSSIQGAQIYLSAAGPAGLIGAIHGKLTNSITSIKVTRKDCRHPFCLRVPTSDVATCWQIFVHKEYDFLVAEQPQVIVDAGANIGLASISFANRFPQALILAIEPESSNFEMLLLNTEPYPNIRPLQAALWNRNEEIDLLDPGLGKWGFMTGAGDVADQLPATFRHRVRGITIEQVMCEFALAKIDILKLDIEGAEREVFSDTSSWIGKVDAIIVELHERMKIGCEQSFARGARGFRDRWTQGENIYLSRGHYILAPLQA
jgi:FkbM family methyltransferase